LAKDQSQHLIGHEIWFVLIQHSHKLSGCAASTRTAMAIPTATAATRRFASLLQTEEASHSA
jgi:hypothetical protein